MEKNHSNLQTAISRFPVYEPGEQVWDYINAQLEEQPLRKALAELPGYEPDERLWNLIDAGNVRRQRWKWGYVAAALLVAAGIGSIFVPSGPGRIAYSQEMVDERLQVGDELKTDQQYQLLKTYCDTETLVCDSREYKTLQQEYEMRSDAAERLSKAIGDYNTEPGLMKQYNEIERQKTDILNEVAKMI